ncbi:hypothetical protein [Streptomyces luteogriseus]|uniref:hypothetical protein n=1 Tax=Streptomyces luteogriseus TaxID=68233 RepID=UPI0037ADB45F
MVKRGDSEPGKKPARRTPTGVTKVSSGLGRAKGDKPRSSASSAVPKNLYEFKSQTRSAAPVSNRSLTIKAGKTKAATTVRAKRKNPTDPGLDKTKPRRSDRIAAALAHHDRPITTAEARRMNEIMKADRPVPELRPRRR